MIQFLFKGIWRDRSRSLLPIIVVSIGVMITVIMHTWINGIMGESIEMNANFLNGHVKVMSKAYAKEAGQMPNDLALLDARNIVKKLETDYPDLEWEQRIRFGALLDFPDSLGETRAQGPVVGWAINLLAPGSKEAERFNIAKALVSGHLPSKPGEALISSDLAEKFKVQPGEVFTLFGTTMDGGMAFKNFTLAGTVRFGITTIDRGAIVVDLADAQSAFQMEDAAGEILGFFINSRYDDKKAQAMASNYNAQNAQSEDEFAPQMLSFKQQEGMADLVDLSKTMGGVMIFVFVMAMSVVLWNAGLLSSLRRFNEFGVRLALGEAKNHIYKTLLLEGVLVGLMGTLCGTALGLSFSYLLQERGVDIGGMMKNATLMFPDVARAAITPAAFYIGFIPGVLSTVLGNALAGIQIYKRQTAQLFKELEV